MESVGLSARRNNLGIGQAIDLAGEQSYVKNAKTVGHYKTVVFSPYLGSYLSCQETKFPYYSYFCKISHELFSFIIYGGEKAFATSESTVAKWVMNRPFQSRFVESLIEITGLSKTTKCSAEVKQNC